MNVLKLVRLGVFCFVFLFFFGSSYLTARSENINEEKWVDESEISRGGRDLLFNFNTDPSKNCVDGQLPTHFKETYGRIIFPLLCIYICIGLGIICEASFQDSLFCISELLELSPDVAGATFMAAGTSAPELFISLLALGEPDDAMGMGTIVGSVVFNVLVICGLCGLLSKTTTVLKWRILMRDCFWNFVAFSYLLGSFWDETITPLESVVGLLLYVMYVAVMVNSNRLVTLIRPAFVAMGAESQYDFVFDPKGELRNYQAVGDEGQEDGIIKDIEDDDYYPYTTHDEGGFDDLEPGLTRFENERSREFEKDDSSYFSYDEDGPLRSPDDLDSPSSPEEPDYHFHEGYLIWPESVKDQVEFVLTIPFRLLFALTVPPVKQFGKYTFVLTFGTSVLWLAILSYFLILWVSEFGCSIHLGSEAGNAIMGLTFLAIGTSMPDCLTSIFVAMSGRVEMAICNALGSNMFDILLALALPWSLKLMMSPDKFLVVENPTLQRDIGIMFLVIVFFAVALGINKFRLTKPLGATFCCVYCLFACYSVLSELKIIPF